MSGRWINRIDEGMLQVLTDEHHHNIQRWYGAKAGADETNAVDDVLTAFQIDSGNDTWGTALCIVGSGDTPIDTGMTHFHFSNILIVDRERATPYKIRIAWGDSYTAGISAGHYTEKMLLPADEANDVQILLPRLDVGTRVFASCWVGANTGTLDFFIGIHESRV